MVYRITGGIFFLCLGLSMAGIAHLESSLIGVVGIIAGLALLAGI